MPHTCPQGSPGPGPGAGVGPRQQAAHAPVDASARRPPTAAGHMRCRRPSSCVSTSGLRRKRYAARADAHLCRTFRAVAVAAAAADACFFRSNGALALALDLVARLPWGVRGRGRALACVVGLEEVGAARRRTLPRSNRTTRAAQRAAPVAPLPPLVVVTPVAVSAASPSSSASSSSAAAAATSSSSPVAARMSAYKGLCRGTWYAAGPRRTSPIFTRARSSCPCSPRALNSAGVMSSTPQELKGRKKHPYGPAPS